MIVVNWVVWMCGKHTTVHFKCKLEDVRERCHSFIYLLTMFDFIISFSVLSTKSPHLSHLPLSFIKVGLLRPESRLEVEDLYFIGIDYIRQ